MESENYRLKTSGRLIPMMSQRLYEDKMKAIEELVANAYDADATKVYVTIANEKGVIIVQDNGVGMDKEGLTNFFDLGTDVKERTPFSTSGRRKIGAFGIGKIASNRIANKVTLYTLKNGLFRSVQLDFRKLEKLKKLEDFVVKCTPVPIDQVDPDFFNFQAFRDQNLQSCHGTFVGLEELKSTIDLSDVRRTLRYNMPLQPDFKIYLNGSEIKEVRITNPEKIFNIDEALSKIGHVHGKLVYASSSLSERAGIWIRVHGRVVNKEGNWLDVARIKAAFMNRLYGDIHADGLNDVITLDREGFDKSSDKWKIFRDFIEKKVKEDVAAYYRKKLREKELKEFAEASERAAGDLSKMLEGEDITILPHEKVRIGGDKSTEGKLRSLAGSIDPKKLEESIITFDNEDKRQRQKQKKTSVSSPTPPSSGGEIRTERKPTKNILVINKVKFKLTPWRGGREGPECELYRPKNMILVNVEYPQLVLCHRESFDAVRACIRRAVLLRLAQEEIILNRNGTYKQAIDYFDELLRKADKLLLAEDYADLGFSERESTK